MCYITAKEVLPIEIIELIQKYVDGEYIYIPKKENCKSGLGTRNNTREQINISNYNIYNEYMNGATRKELAYKYFLSNCLSRRSI